MTGPAPRFTRGQVLDLLAGGPDRIAAATAGVSAEELLAPLDGGGWSARAIQRASLLQPDRTQRFEHGGGEVVRIGELSVGREGSPFDRADSQEAAEADHEPVVAAGARVRFADGRRRPDPRPRSAPSHVPRRGDHAGAG